MKLNIDQEYKALIPPLSAEEFAQLESNILRDGCLHPIVTWEETIIDGHNRYAICKKHDLPFKIIAMEFDDRDAAMDWMDTNQLGRRNLSPVDFKLALGRRYNRTKKTKAEAGAIGGSSKDQNDTCLENTAAKLATQHGVSEATVKRAGKLAEAVEAHPEIKEAIASGMSIKDAIKEHKEPETTIVNDVKEKAKKQPQKTLEDQIKEEQNQALGKLKSAWMAATSNTRKEFFSWVEKTKNSTHA
jgi:ParB-like chromosome segregation protein Spo0J